MQSSFPSTGGASQVRRSEGAPESTLEMEPRSTHLPPLQGWVDFLCISWGSASLHPAVAGLSSGRAFGA
jgi:hypothetical protein